MTSTRTFDVSVLDQALQDIGNADFDFSVVEEALQGNTPTSTTAFDFSVLESDAGADAHFELVKNIYNAIDFQDENNHLIRLTWVTGEDGRLVFCLSEALKRPYNKTNHKFCEYALKILAALPGIYDEEEKPDAVAAAAVVNQGGLDIALGFMNNEDDKAHPCNIFTCLAIIYASLYALQDTDKELSVLAAEKALPAIVDQMETNALDLEDEEKAIDIYIACCDIFHRICLVAKDVDRVMFHRMAEAVYAGLYHHPRDIDLQETGRKLLRDMHGDKTALKMIDHLEMQLSEEEETECSSPDLSEETECISTAF